MTKSRVLSLLSTFESARTLFLNALFMYFFSFGSPVKTIGFFVAQFMYEY